MCRVTSKALMGIMTIIFWGAAAGLIFVGAWVFKEYQHYEQLVRAYYTLIPAAILMGVGFFFFILGLIGCIGAFKEQRCLLASFFTILLLILISMVVAAGLGYVYRTDIDDSVKHGIRRGLNNYNNDSVIKEEVDFMQRELQCCGLNNFTDWEHTPWFDQHHDNLTVHYPDSCCLTSPCTNNTNVFNKGCYIHLKDEFRRHLGIIAGVAAGFGILQIFGMIAACGLFCRRRSTNTYIGLTSPEHMRV